MRGSDQLNVIPRRPHIDLDCRLLPGTTPSQLTKMLKDIINNDAVHIQASIEVQNIAENGLPVTPSKGPQWNFVKNAIGAIFPDATVAPFLFIAGTDSKHYTAITDHILRFMPLRMSPEDITLPHNANERIGLHAFKYAQEFLELSGQFLLCALCLTLGQGRRYLFRALDYVHMSASHSYINRSVAISKQSVVGLKVEDFPVSV